MTLAKNGNVDVFLKGCIDRSDKDDPCELSRMIKKMLQKHDTVCNTVCNSPRNSIKIEAAVL